MVAPVLGGFALGQGLGVPYLGMLAALCLVAAGVALSLRRGLPTTIDTGMPGSPVTPGRPQAHRPEAIGMAEGGTL